MMSVMLAGCGTMAGQSPVSGRVTYPYSNGKPRFEFELRDGIPNGRGKAWHPNGKVASEGTYKDGARHGRFWLYDEDGTFVAQVFYIENREVWRSTDDREEPPEEWTEYVETGAEDALGVTSNALRPYFSTLDRTTAPARAGAQVGVGEAKDIGFGAAKRLDVFGHYRIGRYGVYAQFSESRLSLEDEMTLAGRRTTMVAGTYHRDLGFATLSANGGFIVPLGNTDPAGTVASYASAEQRVTDTALALPAPFTVRSGASLTASKGLFLVQVDAGLDWLFGSDARGVDALARANVGIGFGTRSSMFTVELDNAQRLSGSHETLNALALGGTLTYPVMWVSASLVFSNGGTTSFLGSVGRDL